MLNGVIEVTTVPSEVVSQIKKFTIGDTAIVMSKKSRLPDKTKLIKGQHVLITPQNINYFNDNHMEYAKQR